MGVDDILENVLMFLSTLQFTFKIGDILHHSNSHIRQSYRQKSSGNTLINENIFKIIQD